MLTAAQSRQTEQIREHADLAAVVSGYVQLRKSGRTLAGLCPFHGDKRSPSLNVSPEKNLWHCFGCNSGGDVFTFLQRIEGVSFMGARRLLADRYGVALDESPKTRSELTAARRQRVYAEQLAAEAAWFWRRQVDQMERYAEDLHALATATMEWLAKRPADHHDARTARVWLFHCRRAGIRVARALCVIGKATPPALLAVYRSCRARRPEIETEYREERMANGVIEQAFEQARVSGDAHAFSGDAHAFSGDAHAFSGDAHAF